MEILRLWNELVNAVLENSFILVKKHIMKMQSFIQFAFPTTENFHSSSLQVKEAIKNTDKSLFKLVIKM